MNRARPLLLGDTEGLAHLARDAVAVDDLSRVLRDRTHHLDDVDDLKVPLFARLDRLLPGQHEHRHGPQGPVRRRRDQVGGTGPERGQACTGAPRQPTDGRRHEAGSLLVSSDDQANAGAPERIDDVEVFLPGHAEHVFDAFVLERTNQ
jgi:hypothetical protein